MVITIKLVHHPITFDFDNFRTLAFCGGVRRIVCDGPRRFSIIIFRNDISDGHLICRFYVVNANINACCRFLVGFVIKNVKIN